MLSEIIAENMRNYLSQKAKSDRLNLDSIDFDQVADAALEQIRLAYKKYKRKTQSVSMTQKVREILSKRNR